MSSHRFDSLYDFTRNKVNLHLQCMNHHCGHRAVLNSNLVWRWSAIWRWSIRLSDDVMKHFRCSKCGYRRPRAQPTEQPVNHRPFFPRDEVDWKRIINKLRN